MNWTIICRLELPVLLPDCFDELPSKLLPHWCFSPHWVIWHLVWLVLGSTSLALKESSWKLFTWPCLSYYHLLHIHHCRSSWYRWHSSVRNTTMHGGRFPPSEYSCNFINHTTSTSNSREITNSIALPISHNPFTIDVASMGILKFTWLPHLCLGYGWVPVFLDGGVCLGTDVLNALALRASGIFVSVHMFVSLDFIIWPISCRLLIFGALNSSCRLKILSVNVCCLSVWSTSWGLLSSCWARCGTKPSSLA